jgi:hypothetical protein
VPREIGVTQREFEQKVAKETKEGIRIGGYAGAAIKAWSPADPGPAWQTVRPLCYLCYLLFESSSAFCGVGMKAWRRASPGLGVADQSDPSVYLCYLLFESSSALL